MPPAADKTPESRRTQMYKGVLELALMRLLQDGAQYGLKILDGLHEEAGLDLSEGTLYPLLHRLEKAGLIKSEWRHEAEASHPRKYYGLTPAGATELKAQGDIWLEMTERLNAFLKRGN
ncbi:MULTISPECIES: PadR family transcriptional regulator [Asticcacaulis]|uniref:PadR family transcriptional regulator, regulatory protein PadR n=1 Tax=Asticcacaulis taihuensis TaxID=260084 RepID=A0A1G4TRM8_9CAUL|nr:helix-turn-helix transcriptional regulator [Asticcacaulis taihuensis]SCW83990.1 PadR family transcriptional regulator, regulatory protein PadR [Asticcacaulis taihuensis]